MPDETLHCSFCGKSQHEVEKLVAGPDVYICDRCAELVSHYMNTPDVKGQIRIGADGRAVLNEAGDPIFD